MNILLIYSQPATLAAAKEFAESREHTLVAWPGFDEFLSNPDSYVSDLNIVEFGSDLPHMREALQETKYFRRGHPTIYLGTGTGEEISLACEFGAELYLNSPPEARVLWLAAEVLLNNIRLQKAVCLALEETAKVHKELDGSVERQKEAIAERELTYRELLLAYSRLQELNQLKNNFLAKATHELRTPVTVIKGYHRILLDGRLGELPAQQKEVLLESELSCSRLIKIINSLLDFSRLESGKLELIYQDFDLASNAKLVISQLGEMANKKDLLLRLKIDQTVPHLNCDRDKINQVLTNLLDNAIKFTPPGGRISVSAWPLYWDKRSLPSRSVGSTKGRRSRALTGQTAETLPKNAVMVEVCDTGPGISPEHQRAIFEEFTQISSQPMQRSGLGLGLAISRRIIEAHGGRIWVETEINKGSCFMFVLPLSPVGEIQ